MTKPLRAASPMINADLFQVGMGAHIRFQTDRIPVTVVSVEGGAISLRGALAMRAADGTQSYQEKPAGRLYRATLRLDGSWCLASGTVYPGVPVFPGYDASYDYTGC